MILSGCRSGHVVRDTPSGGDNECLACLGVSYRIKFLSLVSTRSNIDTCRESRLSFVVSCWVPTMSEGSTCSTCTPSLCGAGEVWLYHQKPGSIRQKLNKGLAVVLLYVRLQDLIIQFFWPATAGFNTTVQTSRPELDSAFTHNKGLTYWVTWCDCR